MVVDEKSTDSLEPDLITDRVKLKVPAGISKHIIPNEILKK